MGMKLIFVCALALVMSIPALFVNSLVDERTSRAAQVTQDIGQAVGGAQTILGPTLAIPYSIPASGAEAATQGTYLVFPAQASAHIATKTEERQISLFKVPVFQADLKLEAEFDLTGVPAAAPVGSQFNWTRAEIIIGISDPRGARSDATLTTGAGTAALTPSALAETLSINQNQNDRTKLVLFGAKAATFAAPGAKFTTTSQLRISGAGRVEMLAYGKSTHLAVEGDWPNPGFLGGMLPTERTVTSRGFSATWAVPFIARGVRAEGPSDLITRLDTTALGVSFVEVADPYQSVTRSLKYALLFLGLIFITYYVFETTTRKRVHPAQYLLVGLAQIIFYLLLLSLAERIGFGYGFLVAASVTVALLAVNAGWVFAQRAQAVRAFAIFVPLYGCIYLLLRLEDNALLVGAFASFAALAATMYFTRGVDWYGSATDGNSLPQPMSQLSNPELHRADSM